MGGIIDELPWSIQSKQHTEDELLVITAKDAQALERDAGTEDERVRMRNVVPMTYARSITVRRAGLDNGWPQFPKVNHGTTVKKMSPR